MNRALSPRASLSAVELHHALHLEGMTFAGESIGMRGSWLVEDLRNRRYSYEATLSYDGVSVQRGDQLVGGLLGELSEYKRDEPKSLLFDLVAAVARDHLVYGRSQYELFDASDDVGTTKPRLGVLAGWSLRRRWGVTLQIARASGGGITWNRLPAAALVEFPLPGKLGNDLHRVAKRLRMIELRSATGMETHSAGYDFKAHQRMLDDAAAKATASIGWDGRGGFLDRATSSYRRYRELRFAKTWLLIVAAVTDTLNQICSSPAVHGGDPFVTRVEGLPSIAEVDDAMTAVTTGARTLDEIWSSILHPR